MKSKISMSGQIIKELSEKIPSNVIALNELVKNSYDAGAKNVWIEIDSENKLLIIEDDGEGMTRKDIDVLLHISKSQKNYGQKNKFNRITQGSKGLGFLSVFKFGNQVKWETKNSKENGYEFSIDYMILSECEDLTNYDVEIFESERQNNGTKIQINLKSDSLRFIRSYFKDERNLNRILYAFTDKDFVISLRIDAEISKTNINYNFFDIFKDAQIFHVLYDSEEQKIKLEIDNTIVRDKKYTFNQTGYSVSIELVVYKFTTGGTRRIDKLFHRYDNEITPLIYINNNLFNNYDLFNPDIMRSTRSTESIHQMIGRINIYSKNRKLDFNSDRTQFIQNELTENIKAFLFNINKAIQLFGSKYYNKYLKGIQTDNRKKRMNFGSAHIKLVANKQKLDIPSEQINLYNQIQEAKNSMGKNVEYREIKIKIDDDAINIKNGIIESIDEEKIVRVIYEYKDKNTGIVTVEQILEFVSKRSIVRGVDKEESLIVFPTKSSHKISYCNSVSKLINQINSLDTERYLEVIASSLRSIFEISLEVLNQSGKFESEFKGDIISNTSKLINFCRVRKNIEAISTETGINKYKLFNILNVEHFKSALDTAHLGAHHSSKAVTVQEIRGLSKKAGLFVVFVDILFHSDDIINPGEKNEP